MSFEKLLWAAEWAIYALEHGSSVEVHWLNTVAKENYAKAKECIAEAKSAPVTAERHCGMEEIALIFAEATTQARLDEATWWRDKAYAESARPSPGHPFGGWTPTIDWQCRERIRQYERVLNG